MPPLESQRPQTVPIDPETRRATGSMQWLLEKNVCTNELLTFNNELNVFVCGQEGFAAIAESISKARKSIDIICWGFDPGMELLRSGSTWPRGETFGDLLIRKAQQGVQVRLLIWKSTVGSFIQKNMPGYSHDSAQILQFGTLPDATHFHQLANTPGPGVATAATLMGKRACYCAAWYAYAIGSDIPNLEIRLRNGNSDAIKAALKLAAPNENDIRKEKTKPDAIENPLFLLGGTHHQKPILIDYDAEPGQDDSTVAYVMGLNSMTDYWDSSQHLIDDPLRELNRDSHEKKLGYQYKTPYRDYACRVKGGALIAINRNFCLAWDRAANIRAAKLMAQRQTPPPSARAKSTNRHSKALIVRTQPEEQDKSIKALYFQAITPARQYIYIENQYFYYEEFAQHLMTVRKNFVNLWLAAKQPAEKLPILYVFLVIPPPESEGMIPRTYDTLATLGQAQAMPSMAKKLANFNDPSKINFAVNPDVLHYSSRIESPSLSKLETQYGLRVLPLTLTTSGMITDPKTGSRKMAYRDIYIHSKLMLIDDGFFTIGSANMNQRSMAVDSEINIATDDLRQAAKLRQRVWSNLAGEENDGGGGTLVEIEKTFTNWKKLSLENKIKKKNQIKNLDGFLMPLEEKRSATVRVG